MSKTWYGHYIETIKGTDYVLFKDYLELDKEIERLNNIINGIEEEIKTKAPRRIEANSVDYETYIDGQYLYKKLQELKGSDK